jgi:hypothetical protein
VLCVVVDAGALAAAARSADCNDGMPPGGVVDSSALTAPEPESVIELEIPLTPLADTAAPDVESDVPDAAETAVAGSGCVPIDPPPVLHAATIVARPARIRPSRIRDKITLHRCEEGDMKQQIAGRSSQNDAYHHGERPIDSRVTFLILR